jgi:hypothetical protein
VGEFRRRGISTVVCLNEPSTYDKELFQSEGIEVVDLELQDCTTPSPAVTKRFLDAVDSAKGVVAVHCMASLGRSGTLIAIHTMKHHGFSGLRARLLRARSHGPGAASGVAHEVWEHYRAPAGLSGKHAACCLGWQPDRAGKQFASHWPGYATDSRLVWFGLVWWAFLLTRV